MVSSNLLATRLCLPLLPTIALTNVLSSTATGKLFQGNLFRAAGHILLTLLGGLGQSKDKLFEFFR